MDRKRIVVSLVLLLCVALLVRWAMRSDDSVSAPGGAESVASVDRLPRQAHSPAIAQPGVDAAPATDGAAATDASSSALGTLRGSVIDAVTREPLHAFQLEFQRSRPGEDGNSGGARTFRTDDGRFEWLSLLPGRWTVTASARGYQRFELMNVLIVRGDATPELTLPLRPGRTLRGRVYDEISGAGVASARVRFRDAGTGRGEEDWRLLVHASSQPDGSFVLEGVPAGRVTLEVRSPEYVARDLDVTVGDAALPLEIGLSAGSSIAGRLVAADGLTPAVGTAAAMNINEGLDYSVATDETGGFAFLHLAPGRHALKGQARGGAATQEIALGRNQRIEGIVLVLQAARSIRGLVRGLPPEELKQVTVSVSRTDGVDFPSGFARVDERGAYVLHGVQAGSVAVVASVNMRRNLSSNAEVPADADITVDFDFSRGSRLSGRVTRAGKALPRVSILPLPVVRRHDGVFGKFTSEQGQYVIEGLPDGEYTVRAGTYMTRPFQVSGDTVLDIEMPATQLSGRVIEDADVSVAGAEIAIWSTQPGPQLIRLLGRSDAFGQFEFIGLERGDFLLTVYKPGYELFRERISYVSPIAGMTIRLHESTGVEVRVHEAESGAALQRIVALEMTGELGGTQLELNLDANGLGYIPGGLAGSSLTFFAPGYVSAVIHEWDGQPLDLQLAQQVAQ